MTDPGGLRVVELDPWSDPRWERFVSGRPDRLLSHHPAWLRVLEAEYGRRPTALACEDAGGELRGVLPLLSTRGLPFTGQIGRRRLSSLPRTPLAGPLALDRDARAALVGAALERVRARDGLTLELKAQGRELDGLADGVVALPWRLTYVVELPERPEELRFGSSRNHSAIKRAVGKAARAGVHVRPAETENELRAWYPLYLATMREHALPPRSLRFFRALWHHLQPLGFMRLLLAEQVSGGHRRLLAGSVLFPFGETVSYAFNGRRADALPLRPNDATHWQAMETACREGYRRYDFGEVSAGNAGLTQFKRKWVHEPQQLYRYYYPAPERPEAAESEGSGPVGRLARATWRRLPLPVTARFGDWLYYFL